MKRKKGKQDCKEYQLQYFIYAECSVRSLIRFLPLICFSLWHVVDVKYEKYALNQTTFAISHRTPDIDANARCTEKPNTTCSHTHKRRACSSNRLLQKPIWLRFSIVATSTTRTVSILPIYDRQASEQASIFLFIRKHTRKLSFQSTKLLNGIWISSTSSNIHAADAYLHIEFGLACINKHFRCDRRLGEA